MRKKILYVAVLILIMISMSGNWSKSEPKELAIGTSFIYDIKEDGTYKVTVEILDITSSSQNGGETKSFLVNMEGDTIPEAIRDPSVIVDKKIYGAHNRVRFFSDRFARKDMKEILDVFMRDIIADERPYMLVVKNPNPLLIHEADIGLADLLGSYIDTASGMRNESSTSTVFVDTLSYIKDYYREGKQPVMGVIEAVENKIELEAVPEEEKPSKYIVKLEGLAAFKNNKMVGYLDGKETRTYNLIADKVRNAFISVPIEEEYITASILKAKPDIKTSFKDGKVFVDITLKLQLLISQNETNYDLSETKDLKIAEEATNFFLEQEMLATISKVQQEYASDIFGFGIYFHRQNHAKWKEIKTEWDDEYFANAEIYIKVDSSIDYEGKIREKFGERVTYD